MHTAWEGARTSEKSGFGGGFHRKSPDICEMWDAFTDIQGQAPVQLPDSTLGAYTRAP